MNNPEEQLPEELNLSNDAELHQALIEFTNPNLEGDCTFRKILNHSWNDGILMLKAQHVDPMKGNFEMDMPLKKLKKDEPLACAKHIHKCTAENRRGHRPLNEWASQTIKLHSSMIRRIARINPSMESLIETQSARMVRDMVLNTIRKTKATLSRNQRNFRNKNREKFGIRIPNTIAEALQFDREAGNNKWAEAIAKEMNNLNRLDVFKYHPSHKQFPKEEGWQKAPLRMIFDIKNEDQRYKARLVIGGHKVDSTGYNVYSSQVDNMSVLLLFLIAKHVGLNIMTCDVSNAFVTAPNSEKVWAVAGDEFGDKKGSMVEIQRALYGLAGSARAFADFLADTLIRLGFTPSRADPDLWIKVSKHGYDMIATHVDDLIVVAKNPEEYISLIEQEYALRNIEVDPLYYLGSRLKRLENGKIQMNMEEFSKEAIGKYETKHSLTLKKENMPIAVDAKPELDDLELLNLD